MDPAEEILVVVRGRSVVDGVDYDQLFGVDGGVVGCLLIGMRRGNGLLYVVPFLFFPFPFFFFGVGGRERGKRETYRAGLEQSD